MLVERHEPVNLSELVPVERDAVPDELTGCVMRMPHEGPPPPLKLMTQNHLPALPGTRVPREFASNREQAPWTPSVPPIHHEFC